jgi:hypothetical protein
LTISTLIWYRSARHRLSVPYPPGSGRKRCRSCWLTPGRTCPAWLPPKVWTTLFSHDI